MVVNISTMSHVIPVGAIICLSEVGFRYLHKPYDEVSLIAKPFKDPLQHYLKEHHLQHYQKEHPLQYLNETLSNF